MASIKSKIPPMKRDIMRLRGDVSTMGAYRGLSSWELEYRIGYETGRLAYGYDIYKLCEKVFPRDFIWKDQTLFSGGWRLDSGLTRDGEESYYAQAFDLFRAELGKRLSNDELSVDAYLAKFMNVETSKMNVRIGPEQIVKILPVAPDPGKGVFWLKKYPNSKARGTNQWTLVCEKMFVRIATVRGDRSTVPVLNPGGRSLPGVTTANGLNDNWSAG